MLYGMSLLYGATGTTDLAGMRQPWPASPRVTWSGSACPAIILLLAGFGFKASLVPFHQWAPDTYEGAPTPVTAFLSTASKATGFAILIRVFLVALGDPALQAEWTALLIAISVVTMTIGNLTALRQTNVKRLLAYSSIAQAGYMLMGVAAVLLDPQPDLHRHQRRADLPVRLPVHQRRRLCGGDCDRGGYRQDRVEGLCRAGQTLAMAGRAAVRVPRLAGRHPADGRLHGQVLRLRRCGPDARCGSWLPWRPSTAWWRPSTT